MRVDPIGEPDDGDACLGVDADVGAGVAGVAEGSLVEQISHRPDIGEGAEAGRAAALVGEGGVQGGEDADGIGHQDPLAVPESAIHQHGAERCHLLGGGEESGIAGDATIELTGHRVVDGAAEWKSVGLQLRGGAVLQVLPGGEKSGMP